MGSSMALVLAPLIILEAVLLVLGYVDLARRERVRGGKKWVWALVMLISLIGPVIYFVMGREE
jgi:hypothetical protein